ncbi:hypothetical protein H7H51_28515 [Mycolicibacterium farcinogenes]|nr:hypothetical protein [Mycolicibacterium farcinogenes]
MIELTAESWFTITGRGRCAVVDLGQLGNQTLRIGDRVSIDGAEYLVEHCDVIRRADPDAEVRWGIVVRKIPPGNTD